MANPVNAYRGVPSQPQPLEPARGNQAASSAGKTAGADVPPAPNRTPASGPYSEAPEPVTYATTSAGAEAAKTMAATWGAATGAEGGPGYGGPTPARTLSPGEEAALQKADEALKKADENACQTIVGGLVKWGTGSKLAAGVASWAICRQPERGPQDAGGEHGSPGAPPLGGTAGASGVAPGADGGAGGASGVGR
jgi:hypothetical protein